MTSNRATRPVEAWGPFVEKRIPMDGTARVVLAGIRILKAERLGRCEDR